MYTTLMDFIEATVDEVTPDEVFRGRANLRVHEGLVEAIASGDPQRVSRAVERYAPHTEWIATSGGDAQG